jgi:hypothetical protein
MMYQASGLLDIQGFDEPGAFGLYWVFINKIYFQNAKKVVANFTCLPFH